ncbi:MAG: ABC transporter substrate-binding protein [Gemmatimonadetes bacterium]|nr:ABC transporter substrate-binding protein [Gemmatimonadota bacterium]
MRPLLLPSVCLIVSCGAPEPARIGVVLGPNAAAAARLAVAEINAAGGIAGRPLDLVMVSGRQANWAQPAIAAAESLATNPAIVAVIGHSNSAASLAASQVYNARGLVHIAPNTTAPLFSQAGPYSFRLVPDDRRQAKFLAAQVGVRASPARVAVVYVNDDYGRALELELRGLLVRHGHTIVYEAPYLEAGDPGHLERVAGTVADAVPEVLVLIGRPLDLEPFLRHLRQRLQDLPILGSDALDDPHVYRNRDGVFTGVRFVRFIDPEAPNPRVQALRRQYQRAMGRELTSESLLTYDAVLLLAEALRSGARDREAVRRFLASVGRERPAFQGLAGPIAFDGHGDVMRSHLLAEVASAGVRAVQAGQ